LGRLYFCGFKVLACKEIGDSLFYIAQKVKTPSFDRNPSYGPVIKLKRIGYGGEVMHVFKLRTMYPYSEYIQEYIYEHHKLQDNGKFKDDFRLTGWGQFMRRLWIDEFPQFINYWRGDLNLVGVRALSQHYFNLYPEELKKFRIQFKPGLVPPYYADMPDSFEEIVHSEWEYLKQKENHPFKTDIKYFIKAFYNIIFKQARSQ
ncbi:MAG: sugar transferase, partial [Calditrichia bacterium]|nr:sugar transferase [Calditrichia bacterium]